MYLLDASPSADGCSYIEHSVVSVSNKQTLPADKLACPLQSPLLCGQTRITIGARHFASLIGRLCIGGH